MTYILIGFRCSGSVCLLFFACANFLFSPFRLFFHCADVLSSGMPLCYFPRVFLSSRSTWSSGRGGRASGCAFDARELASVSSVHSWTGDPGVALLRRTPANFFVPVGSPSSSLHAQRGVGEGESSGAFFSVLGCLSHLISARSARWWGGWVYRVPLQLGSSMASRSSAWEAGRVL